MVDIVNDGVLEPTGYFENLKSKLNVQERETLENQLVTIGAEIQRAKELGLSSVLHKLSFAYLSILKEQVLLMKGYKSFVYREDVLKFIEKVQPKNSIKICELSRYPRLIPEGPAKAIAEVKNLEVFDNLFIVYTDFTNQSIETPEEKEYVARNRDPVVFGAFHNSKLDFKHDRYYFITDWEDEYCDLTFTKMLEKMSSLGLPGASEIKLDQSYLNKVATESLAEAEEVTKNRHGSIAGYTNKKSWFQSLKEKLGFGSD